MEISGKIIHVLQVQAGTSQAGRQWKSLDFVIETQESRPRKICFNLFGSDRVDQNQPMLAVGKEVTVSFDVESRESQGRWFTKASAFRVAPMSQQTQYQQPYPQQYAPPAPQQAAYATQPPQQYQPTQQPQQAYYPGQQYAQMAQPSQQVPPPAPSPTGYPSPIPGGENLPF